MGVVRRCCPVVSIVIVNYNGGALVSEAVHAALRSFIPLEIIVADNGSSDGSFDFLRKCFSGNPRVHFMDNGSNIGFARANNLAIRQTRGQYILLLNPDCLIFPETLQRAVDVIQSRPQVGMVGCLLRNPDGSEQAGCRRVVPTPWRTIVRIFHLDKLFPRHRRFRSFVLVGTPLPKEPTPQEAISGAFMLVRREAIDQVGPLDENYFLHCEDLDWCMRFRQTGWEILFVPSAEAVHYKGYCSRTRPGLVLYHLHKGMVRFYRKFFRHQYPAPLMWVVAVAVWMRFILLVSTGWLKRVYTGGTPAMVPRLNKAWSEELMEPSTIWWRERKEASVLALDQSEPVVARQHWVTPVGERRTTGSDRIDPAIPMRRKSDRA
jgi:GT2 family glycosyltransferase